MRILVAGGAGFLGGALVPALVRAGHHVSATTHIRGVPCVLPRMSYYKADLTRPEDCAKIVKGHEVVYALARVTGGSGKLAKDPLSFVTPNILINTQLFKACAEAGVTKVIYNSSTTAYPDTDLAMREEDYFIGEPAYFHPGHTNRSIERLAQMYPELNVTCIRPTMIYGPGDCYDLELGHVIPALIRKVAERQNPITLWGDGTAWRDAVHIDDVVRALVLAMDAPAGAFNIATGEGMTVNEILAELCDHADHDPVVNLDLSKPQMLKKRALVIEKAKRVLGWEPAIRMRDGLRSTLDWYARQ